MSDGLPSSVRKSRAGRPPLPNAAAHAAIMDAVYSLLLKKSVRDLTMQEIAKKAKVGKPTLYKWWPTKAALVMAMFHERLAVYPEALAGVSAKQALRGRVRRLIHAFNGPFGKVIADLIAEGQSEPAILRELYERHLKSRRAATIAELERGMSKGELQRETNPDLLVDAIFGGIYYRLLLRTGPLTEEYGEALVEQVLKGHLA